MQGLLRNEREEDLDERQGYERPGDEGPAEDLKIFSEVSIKRKNSLVRQSYLSQELEARGQSAAKIKTPKVSLEIRSCVLFYCLILVLGYLLANIYKLQHSSSDEWEKIASRQHLTSKQIKGVRGSIFDREGRPLAVSIQTFKAGTDLKRKPDLEKLSKILKKEYGQAYDFSKEYSKKKRFFWFSKGIHPDSQLRKELSLIKGITLTPEHQRVYPQGDLAATVIGKVGTDGNGLSGIEKYFDSRLLAENQKLSVRRDAKGRLVAKGLNSSSFEKVRNEGKNLKLSTDTAIEAIMADEIAIGRLRADAKGVMAMMMEAETGEILGISQTQSFNPNTLESLDPINLRSNVLQNSFEPGSTVKPLIIAKAIENGLLSPNEIIDSENGRLRLGKHTIRDVSRNKKLTIPEVLSKSSNVCMTKIASRFSPENLRLSLKEFGFGKQSGIEWPGESTGLFRDLKDLKDIDSATFSFGYGFSVSMVQMLRAYSAIANNGDMPEASLVMNTNNFSEKALDEESSSIIKDMLHFVVENKSGTASNAQVPGLKVYGKTGTANKVKKDGPGYSNDRVSASFIGFAQNPKTLKHLVLYVVVDEPMVKPRYGGTVAAPIFSKIMGRTVDYLNAVN